MRAPIAPIGWSIALHAVLVGLLILGLTLPEREPQQAVLPIDAVVVDDAVLEAAGQKRRNDERVADEKRKRDEAEAERLEQERLEQQEEEKRQEEQQRLESEQAAEQKARAEAEAKLKGETEAKQKAEQEAQAKAAAEKKRAAQVAKLRQEREADLRARLAEEETRTSAGFQSLKSSYVSAIQAHVEQRWYEPPGTTQGLVCRVYVMQIPGGEVVSMRFGSCNGGAAVRQSIETAVHNSSPLPAPPEPALFEREVELVFTPKEPRR
ncbi:MAG: cell envelope integrity protein TolA [Steroidobacteraceae bacterium]